MYLLPDAEIVPVEKAGGKPFKAGWGNLKYQNSCILFYDAIKQQNSRAGQAYFENNSWVSANKNCYHGNN